MLTRNELNTWFHKDLHLPYIIPNGHVLIELLVYEPKASGLIMNRAGYSHEGQHKIYPYAKVLDVGEKCETWGHTLEDTSYVIALNSKLAHVKETEAFKLWAKEHKNERPYKVPPPVRYVGLIIDWQDRYHFPLNRFIEPHGADLFRFCIPEHLISGALPIEELHKFLVEADSIETAEDIQLGSAMDELRKLDVKNLPIA